MKKILKKYQYNNSKKDIESFERIKQISLVICFCCWLLDIFSTYICLTYGNNLSEGNPLIKFFLDMGNVGYLLSASFVFIVLFIVIYFVIGDVFIRLYKYYTNEEMTIQIFGLVCLVFTMLFSLTELFAVVSNLLLLIQKIIIIFKY